MFRNFIQTIINIFKSRIFILIILFSCMFGGLIYRIFVLQIVNGESYLTEFSLKLERTTETSGTRGNITDRNGNVLAYDELAYSVTMADTGSYQSTGELTAKEVKNKELNATINKLLNLIIECGDGDKIINDYSIMVNSDGTYSYTVSDTSLYRFLRDMYGEKTIDSLSDEQKATTAQQAMDYLRSSKKYGIDETYTNEEALRILIVREAFASNSYQRYMTTTIASDVSDETVTAVSEYQSEITGVEIEQETVRRYVDSEYFAHIIGYTGKISQTQYDALTDEEKEDYSLNDIVGKFGIELEMESSLRGVNGSETLYVDSVGRVIETISSEDAKAGNDVTLTVDKDLQIATYKIIEQRLAGILSSRISENEITLNEVYFALVNNNVIDINNFSKDTASDTEKNVYATFAEKQSGVISQIQSELTLSPVAYNDMSDEYKAYYDYIYEMLQDNSIIVSAENIDTTNDDYKAYRVNGTSSLRDYLMAAINNGWINSSSVIEESKYSNTDEIYNAIVNWIITNISTEKGFSKIMYQYLIEGGLISGKQLCLILYDQGVLAYDEAKVTELNNGGSYSANNFIIEKIANLEITPAQLALDPCSASCVVTDVNTGEVLACVTYPSYDNNEFSGTIDANYYSKLNEDLSSPMYNRATQVRTAPGSTFKPLTSVAALEENYITPSTTIADLGEFTTITPSPKCWIYTSSHTTHGTINVSEAIRDSCNYFYYQVGYWMGTDSSGNYSSELGLSVLSKYATLFGLNEKSGIELEEAEPIISYEDAVRSAIGQGKNSYTNIQLARYTAALANSGTVFDLSIIDKTTDSNGNVIEDYTPEVVRTLDDIDDSTWNAVHAGMRMVVESSNVFSSLNNSTLAVAGKSGTAQENLNRADHALFISYAPYENPEVAVSVVIPNGDSSSNAASVASDVMKYYFKVVEESEVLNGSAAVPVATTTGD